MYGAYLGEGIETPSTHTMSRTERITLALSISTNPAKNTSERLQAATDLIVIASKEESQRALLSILEDTTAETFGRITAGQELLSVHQNTSEIIHVCREICNNNEIEESLKISAINLLHKCGKKEEAIKHLFGIVFMNNPNLSNRELLESIIANFS